MLIDFLTFRIPADKFENIEQFLAIRQLTDRIQRYSLKDGTVIWESQAWDSVRSDSHQLAVKVGSDALWIQGSPSRVIGDSCNVFSSGPVSNLDIIGSVKAMVNHIEHVYKIDIPKNYYHYKVSRIDITGNLLMPSLADVRTSLSVLKNIQGGRYRVSQTAGDTVYYSHKSRLISGKAYAKGPHLQYQNKKGYTNYSDEQIEKANRLLRLELTIRSQQIRERIEKNWYELTNGDLYEMWDEYFRQKIGNTAMTINEMKIRIFESAPSNRSATLAINLLHTIQSQGYDYARSLYSKSAFYRHMKILRNAGLTDLEITTGNVVSFNRRIIDYCLVSSWDDIKAA